MWEGSDDTTWEPEENFNNKNILKIFKKELKKEEAMTNKKNGQQKKTKIRRQNN